MAVPYLCKNSCPSKERDREQAPEGSGRRLPKDITFGFVATMADTAVGVRVFFYD